MDPLWDMMMTNKEQQSKRSNSITVEEGMDCRDSNSRFFSLINHETKLNVIISKTSTLISCKLAGHELIVNERQYRQAHETWALGDRPYQKIGSLPWNCHVRGSELLLSTLNSSSSMLYELTRYNELTCLVKFKSIHLQHPAIYFNLNNAKEKVPIDGHRLVVQCNGNMNRISVQNTKLLCQCNKRSSILPQSLVGDVPFELVQHDASVSFNDSEQQDKLNDCYEDDLIVCDAIFSLESTCLLDYLRVQLQYHNRILVFECRSSSSSSSVASTNQSTSSTSVSSSTTTSKGSKKPATLLNNIRTYPIQRLAPGESSIGFVGSSEGNSNDFESDNEDPKAQKKLYSSPVDNSPSTSSTPSNTDNPQSTVAQGSSSTSLLSSSHPSTILRARVRVTNFGVCIMPIMMTNYSFTYRFSWDTMLDT